MRGVVLVGTERFTFPLADDERKKFAFMRSLAPHWVVAYHRGWWFRAVEDEATFLLAPSRYPLPIRLPLFWAWVTLTVVRLTGRPGARVLVSQSPYDGSALLVIRALLWRRRRDVTVVVQVQGEWETVLPLVHRWARPLRWLWRVPLAWAVRKADVVRAISTTTAEHARQLGADRVVVFPTWTDFDLFSTPVEGLLPTAFTRPRLVYAGVLTRVKGVDVLLEAFSILRSRGRPATLVIAGDGPERRRLERAARRLGVDGAVRWEGNLPRQRLVQILDEATVFVLPSRSEGLGRVVVEAMARARPVVATSVGGVPDVIVHGLTGVLTRPDDPGSLADCIDELLAHPERAEAMGSRAREAVLRRFGSAVYHEGYRELLEASCVRTADGR